MFRKSVQLLACAALAYAAPGMARDDSLTLGVSWGEVAYQSDRDWTDGSMTRLTAAYDPGSVPVYVELARLESGTSHYDFFEYCGCVHGGIPPNNRELSAWQLGAGYRLWAHRASGSAISVRGGLLEAEAVVRADDTIRYRSTGYFAGIAATYMMTPAFGVRAEWEYLGGLEDIERYDASQAMAGVIVKFGGYPQ